MEIFSAITLIAFSLMVSAVNSRSPVDYYEIVDSRNVASNHSKLLHSSLDVSQSCNNDFQMYLLYLNNIIHSSPVQPPLWVYQLLDATGKPGTGILEGNIQWLGSFTECLKVEVLKQNSAELEFKGKYCTANLAIAALPIGHQLQATNQLEHMIRPVLNNVRNGQLPFSLSIGLCLPSSCTALELNQLINETLTMFQITGVGVTMSEEQCATKEAIKYDTGAIILILVLAAFAALLIIGTLYEIVTIRRNKDESIQAEKSTLENVILSFSVYKNGRKILDTSHTEGTLTCLHGIRFVSMAWVVLGHTYAATIFLPLKNLLDFPSVIRAIAFDIVMSGVFAVDTFFFLSGFLVAYLFIKQMNKTNGKFGPYQIFLFYFHRYWRLTPAMAISIAILVEIYRNIETGPFWNFANTFAIDSCRDNWWKNILYIQNLYQFEKMCFGVSWYLACDMQFYVVSLAIVYPLYRFRTAGLAILGAFFVASVLTPALIIHFEDLPTMNSLTTLGDPKLMEFNDDVYIKPWCRMGPYVIGIILAVILHKTTLKIKLPLMVVAIGWLLAAVLGLTLIFGTHDYITGDKVMSNALNSFYGSCSRPAWAIFVAWVVFACVTGHGGFVNTILSWKALVPLSRLTYSTYLIHMYLLLTFFGSQENVYYFTNYLVVLFYLGMLAISLTLAFLLSLAFEAPFIELEKIFLPQRKSAPQSLPYSQQFSAPSLQQN